MILETERLILRKMQQSDYYDVAEMLQDPDVMYAYEHDFSVQEVWGWIDRQITRYSQDGHGLWAVVSKTNGRMIGQAGLTLQPYKGTKVLEIGYLLKRRYWHCGYAWEAAEGCKKYAFDALGKQRIYAIIKADNVASRRVAERIGMTKEDTFHAQYYNGPVLHDLYSAKNKKIL